MKTSKILKFDENHKFKQLKKFGVFFSVRCCSNKHKETSVCFGSSVRFGGDGFGAMAPSQDQNSAILDYVILVKLSPSHSPGKFSKG